MEFQRTKPALRAHGNMGPPAKKISRARVNKTVSAAAVFQKQNKGINQGDSIPQANLSNLKFTGEDADGTTLLGAKSHSSSRSAEKKRAKKTSSDMHSLGVAFRDASNEYRQHLYNTASLKINKTLESLLHKLYESTLQTITSNSSQQDLHDSPLKLSAPAKYERLATQLYQPISQFTLSLWRTDSEGKSVRFVQTLETRMLHYDDLIAKETAKLGKLQKEWEAVVGEIWKVGATCLGDEAMEEMLFTKQRLDEPALPLSSSPSKATDVESTLFVPEHGNSSPCDRSRVSKKRVTFLEEVSEVRDRYNATPTTQYPNFVHQPSRYRKETLPLAPSLPEEETKELESMVKELGKQEIAEFRKVEKDHQAYWKKKTAQLVSALKSD